jgi:hypothetical protein
MSNKEIGDFCLIPREDLILIPEIMTSGTQRK